MDRTPPTDLSAEQEVLGAILQPEGGQDALALVKPILKPEDFYNSAHRALYTAMLAIDAGNPTDDLGCPQYQALYTAFPTVGDIPTPSYLEELRASIPTAENAEYYAQKVIEAARLRAILQVANEVANKVYEPEAQSIELVGELQELILANEAISASGHVPTAKEDLPNILGLLCTDRNSEYIGFRTGFNKLNKAMLGLRGLSVIGGIPGQGKSSIALQIACEIAKLNSVPVLYYALEMSKNDLYVKILSRLSWLDWETLMIGSYDEGKRQLGLVGPEHDKLHITIEEFAKYAHRIRIIDRSVCRDISIPLVRLHIQQAKRESNTDGCFVVIDHLQIFPVDKQGMDDMKPKLDYLVGEFKAISEQTGASILLISEKNRQSYEKEYLGAFMGSAGIEYGVDFAMLLHEEGEGKQESIEDDKPRKITLKLAKNRFGKRANIPMTFYPECSCFEED